MPEGPFGGPRPLAKSDATSILMLEGKPGEVDTLSDLLFTIEDKHIGTYDLAESIAEDMEEMPILDETSRNLRGVKMFGNSEVNFVPVDNMNLEQLNTIISAAIEEENIVGGRLHAMEKPQEVIG